MAAGSDQTSSSQPYIPQKETKISSCTHWLQEISKLGSSLIASSVEIARSIDDATYHVAVRAAGACAVRALRREPVAERGAEEPETGGRGAGGAGQGVRRPARAARHEAGGLLASALRAGAVPLPPRRAQGHGTVQARRRQARREALRRRQEVRGPRPAAARARGQDTGALPQVCSAFITYYTSIHPADGDGRPRRTTSYTSMFRQIYLWHVHIRIGSLPSQ
jgi:hypothetical protein